MKFPATYGGYTLLAELGEGGMAQVFLARKSGPGGFAKLQVIKRILPQLGKEPEFVQMFLDEARLAARFEHPNVAQVYDLGEAEGSYYLAMEYLAGQSVAGLVKEARKAGIGVPHAFAARIIADACDGLHYVHDFKDLDGTPLNIVHRDVSPQNLFVTYEGRVKLLDFGVAKAANTLTKTRTGSVKGKIAYMAPEQCRGESVDRRADVFALGVVLLELLAGKRIFKNDNEYALIRQISLGEYQKPSEMGFTDAPAELLAVCDRAMAFRADDRYPTCAEMKSDLEAWMSASGMTGARQLAALMGQLFKEDIALRQQVLMARDDSAEVFQKVKQEVSATSQPSLSISQVGAEPRTITKGSTVAQPLRGGPSRAMLALGAALFVLLGGGLALVFKLLQPAPVPMPPPVVVVVPPPVVDAGAAAVQPPQPVVTDEVPDASVAAAVVQPTHPVKKTPPTTKPKPATLTVHAKAEGCTVTIDGTASSAKAELEPGTHEVSVSCPGYAPETKKATVKAGEAATLELSPQPLGKGFLVLKTTPWSVVFDGEKELGMTPLTKLELTAGAHTLRAVNKEQQLDKTFSVTIKPGETTAKTVDLTAP